MAPMILRFVGARTLAAVACIALSMIVGPPLGWADEPGPDAASMIGSVVPTVVSITVRKDEAAPPAAAGLAAASASGGHAEQDIKNFVASGFVIDPSGIIVTNYHVVENAYQINVKFSDGMLLPGKTLSASRLADIALVKVNPPHPLVAARWGDSSKLVLGDQVFAAGNPFGIGLSITAGIISALNRDIQNSPYDDYLQTDAPINHGNSGGPLFNMKGHVVGVDSAIISPTTGSVGLGFALPSNTARFVVERLLTYGWIRPSWIGMKVQQVTSDMALAMGLPQPEGSVVSWVLPGSPAEKGGLRIADVVVDFDGRPPTDERALLRDIAQTGVGDRIILGVLRQGKPLSIGVTTDEWPRDQWDKQDAPVSVTRPQFAVPPDLGLSLGTIPKSQRASIGLTEGLQGVMITSVLPDSDPVRHGIVAGDVILRVADTPVGTPDAVTAALKAARTLHRPYVMMLILPKVRTTPGPQWVALALGAVAD
jgi:serine protease Do